MTNTFIFFSGSSIYRISTVYNMSNHGGDSRVEQKIYSLVFYYVFQALALILLHIMALLLFYWNLTQFAQLAFASAITTDVVVLGLNSRSQEAVKTEIRLDKLSNEVINFVKMASNIYTQLIDIIRESTRKPKEVR